MLEGRQHLPCGGQLSGVELQKDGEEELLYGDTLFEAAHELLKENALPGSAGTHEYQPVPPLEEGELIRHRAQEGEPRRCLLLHGRCRRSRSRRQRCGLGRFAARRGRRRVAGKGGGGGFGRRLRRLRSRGQRE